MDTLTIHGVSGGAHYQSGDDRCVELSTRTTVHNLTFVEYVARIIACAHEQTSRGPLGLRWCDECSTASVWQRPAVAS
jgi:hypothetical protein